MWDIVFDLWQHRNGICHSPDHPWKLADLAEQQDYVRHQFALGSGGLARSDKRYFRDVNKTLALPLEEMVQWLNLVGMARDKAVENAAHQQLRAEARLMENWVGVAHAQIN